jgi:hypothetical protein
MFTNDLFNNRVKHESSELSRTYLKQTHGSFTALHASTVSHEDWGADAIKKILCLHGFPNKRFLSIFILFSVSLYIYTFFCFFFSFLIKF